MTTKTLSDAIAEVKALVGDDDLDPAFITDALNHALADLAPVLRLEAAPVTLAVTVGKADYTSADSLPTEDDLVEIHTARTGDDEEPLREIPIGDFTSTGFKWWNGTLTIQPAPTGSGALKLWYYRFPALLNVNSLGDHLDLPKRWERLPILFAAGETQAQAEELDDEDDFMGQYLRGRALCDQVTSRRAGRKKLSVARKVREWY